MSKFESNCELVRATQQKHIADDDDSFYCELLKYFMTLDYKALLFDSIKDGFIGYEIVNHSKLAYLSTEQKNMCEKAIFNTLKDQDLIHESLGFKEWITDGNNAIVYLCCESTSWLILLIYKRREKSKHCTIPGTWRKLGNLPTPFISRYTCDYPSHQTKF